MEVRGCSQYPGVGGFTLLEIMVVIAIVSIILGFAVLSIDTEPEELNNERKKLTALMKLISEDSVLNSREHRLAFSRRGYAFQKLEEGKWHTIEEGIFRQRQLPPGFSLEVEIDNESILLDDEETPRAAILFLSSGEVSPFTVTIKGRSSLQRTITNLSGVIESKSTEL